MQSNYGSCGINQARGQKFFRARHGRRMSQANALCHFLLDTGFLQMQSQAQHKLNQLDTLTICQKNA
jgi:hypothetical protein